MVLVVNGSTVVVEVDVYAEGRSRTVVNVVLPKRTVVVVVVNSDSSISGRCICV